MGLSSNSELRLKVYQIQDNQIVPIGEIDKFQSLQITKRYYAYGDFSLTTVKIDENLNLLKIGNILYLTSEEIAFVINIVKYELDSSGQKLITCEGRSLESVLAYRIVWGRETFSNKNISTIIYTLFKNAFISSSVTERNISLFSCAEDTLIGDKTSLQKTGTSLYDTIAALAQANEIGFRIKFSPTNLIFEVYKGEDNSNKIVLKTTNDDILQSSLYLNYEAEKNLAVVYGEGEYPNRKNTFYGDSTLSGFMRKELWVDAKDLQSTSSEGTISDDEYIALMQNRGKEKLAENVKNETFEATIRLFGDTIYKLDKDYFLGDKLTIIEEDLNVRIEARITEVTYNISFQGIETELTFGYGYPTIYNKVKSLL